MGSETIATRDSQRVMRYSFINIFRDALIGALMPRQISGAVRDLSGRLGTPVYKFERLHVQLGYLGIGDVFAWIDYAGAVPLPQGWMLCNGQIINEANYNAQHNAGDWANFIGSSSIDGKYLPNMTGVYAAGKSGALQSGSIPITTSGSHVRDFSHNHGGVKTTSTSGNVGTVGGLIPLLAVMPGNHSHSVTIVSDWSAAQDIKPDSVQAQFIMRII